MDRLKTELLKENSIIKFRQIFPPQVWLTPTQEQRCCRVFSNLLTKSNVCKIMFVQQCSSTYADGTFQQSDFISSFHFLLHLNSPVTSDIVEGDGLGNAEAYEEDVSLQFDSSLLFLGWVESCLSFLPPLSRKGGAQSQSWCSQKCPTLEISFDQLILQSQCSSVIPRMVHLCTKPSGED